MSDSTNSGSKIGIQPGADLAPPPELLQRILHMQQMMTVGQSFLDPSILSRDETRTLTEKLVERLQAGNISPEAQAIERARLQEKENQLAKVEGREPREISPPSGTNYFTDTQAAEFVGKYDVTQQANDATGFSATLISQIRPEGTGPDFKREIVIAIRDTEFRPNSLGGGATQDVGGADVSELVGRGAALGQIAQADKWFREQVISKLEPGEKVSIASGSLSGHIGQVLELLYPEYINSEPNSNISFNPTNTATLKDPTGEKTPGQLWREVIDTYTSYRDNPSLAKDWLPQYGTYESGEESRVRALIDRASTSPSINPGDGAVDGNYYDSERLTVAWMATTAKYESMGLRPSILNDPYSGALVDRPGTLSVISSAMAGADITMVPSIGTGNGNFIVVPIQGQNAVVLGGSYTDLGNNHSFYTFEKPLTLLAALQEQRLANGEPLLTMGQFRALAERSGVEMAGIFSLDPHAAGGTEGDSFPNLLNFLRESFVPAGSQFTETVRDSSPYGEVGLKARQSWYASLNELKAQMQAVVDAGGAVKMIDIATLSSDKRVELALEDSPLGDAVRFALKQGSPFATVVTDRDNHSLVPQHVRGSTAIERDEDGNVTQKFEQDIRSADTKYALIIEAREKNIDVEGARYQRPQPAEATAQPEPVAQEPAPDTPVQHTPDSGNDPGASPEHDSAAHAGESDGGGGDDDTATDDVVPVPSLPPASAAGEQPPQGGQQGTGEPASPPGQELPSGMDLAGDQYHAHQDNLQFQLIGSGLPLSDDQRTVLSQQLAQLGLGEVDLHEMADGSITIANSEGSAVGYLQKQSDGAIRYVDSNDNGFEVGADGRSQVVLKGYSETERQQAQQMQAGFGAVQSALSLIQALENGNTFSATLAGVSMVNQMMTLGGPNLPPELASLAGPLRNIGAGLGTISAAMNLADALKSGDALSILQSSANLGAQGIQLYAAMTPGVTLFDAAGKATGTLGNVAQDLGVVGAGVGLVMAIQSGNPVSMVSSSLSLLSAMGYIGPYGAVAAVIISLVSSMFGSDQPMLEGQAQAVWDAAGNTHVITTQDNEGGGATATGWMNTLVSGLQSQLAGMVDANGQPLYGLITPRLPSVGYQYDPDGFNLANGAKGHLYLKWVDENGQEQTRYYDGAGSRGDGTGETLVSDFMKHAMEAVVPAWEAETVRQHYLQDGVSATAKQGERAGMPVEDAQHLTQSFTALSFPAVAVPGAAANAPVYVDIDGDGYLEKTDWISANQGMLAIDLNGDGKIGAGELLNLDPGSTLERNSLRWLDANRDGLLDARDPAFAALKVWIDANHDGLSQTATATSASELQSMAAAGIVAINFGSNPPVLVKADGSTVVLNVQQLTGDVKGVAYMMTVGGLLESQEGGETILHAINTREFDGQAAHTHGGDADTDGGQVLIGAGNADLKSTTSKTLPGNSQRTDTTLNAGDARLANGAAGAAISGQGAAQAAANTTASQVRSNPLAFVPNGATTAAQQVRQVTEDMIRNADNSLFGLSSVSTPLVAVGVAAAATQWPTVAAASDLTPVAQSISSLAPASTAAGSAMSSTDLGALLAGATATGSSTGAAGELLVDHVSGPVTASTRTASVIATLLPNPVPVASAPEALAMFPGPGAAGAEGSVAAGGNSNGSSGAGVQTVGTTAAGAAASALSAPAASADVVLDYPTVVGERVDGIEDIVLRLPESLLLANDSTINFPAFPDRQMLRISSVFSATHGQVALRTNEEGKTEIVFLPEANYHGLASFNYTVTDQYGLSSVGMTTVSIAAVNDAPVVRDDRAAGDEDTVLMFRAADLLANDSDVDTAVDGDVLRITRVGQAQHGQVFLDPDGIIRFIPDQDYNGPAQFTYWVGDRDVSQLVSAGGEGYEIPGTMHLTVIPVNDLPVVTGEQVDSDEDIVLDFAQSFLLANDTDVDIATNGQVLRITAVSNAQHGVVELLQDGTVRFTPELNYFGPAAFSYTVDDGNGGRVVGTTVVNLAPVNDAPDVVGETVSFDEDIVQTIEQALLLANDSDVDNAHSELSIIAVDNATHGIVSLNPDGSIRFVPDADYFGAASFTYTVSDGVGGFTVGTASLQINPVNDAPRLQGETATTDEDQVLHFSVDGLLSNDHDVDNEHSELRLTSVGNASHGTVRLENGEIIFTPDLNYFGAASFTYVVDDGVGGQSEARVDLQFNSVNDVPVVNDELLTGKRNVTYTLTQAALLANDTDVEDPNALSIVAVRNASHGSVVLNPNGTITFVPESGYAGTGSFEYVVRDPDGAEVVGTTQIDFSRINVNPVAVDDSFIGFEDTAFVIAANQLLVNDTDPDPTSLSRLSVSAVGNASHGTVSLQGDGSVRFMPAQDFYGTASFQYQVSDGEGGQTWATAYLNVQAVNDAPVIEDIWYGRPIYGYRWTEVVQVNEGGWVSHGGWRLDAVKDEATAIALGSNPYDVITGVDGASRANDLVDGNGNVIGLSYYRSGQLRPIAIDYVDAMDTVGEGGYNVFDDGSRQNGKVIAYDVDGSTADLSFSIGSGPQHGHAWANQYTATTSPSGIDHTQAGNYAVYDKGAWQYYSHRGDPYSGSDPFAVRVTDAQGASVDAMISTAHVGSSAGGGGKCPIVVDLDGDGIELVKPQDSHMFADLNGQGWRERIGWASTDDGILAFDANLDGHITDSKEISFVSYKEGARTDLEGLAAFDSDGDGKLTSHDALWSSFGILRDLNKNGVQDTGEFISLDQMGITSIGLQRHGTPEVNNGNVVFGTSDVAFADGHTTQAGDVMFGGEITAFPDAAKAVLAAAHPPAASESAVVSAAADPPVTAVSGTVPAAAPPAQALQTSEASQTSLASAVPVASEPVSHTESTLAAMDDLAAIRQMALLFNQVVASSPVLAEEPLSFVPASDHSISMATVETGVSIEGAIHDPAARAAENALST